MFYLNLATGELLPWLATGYKYNDTHTELTSTFDSKAMWSDGQPFTSSDFKFTVMLLRDLKDLLGGGGDLSEFVKSVETPDAHTAVIKMLKPTPRAVALVVVPAAGIDQFAQPGDAGVRPVQGRHRRACAAPQPNCPS
jgi:peptide/nickel transport system substrate-binding protein